MGLLSLAFLGTPEVRHTGRVVSFPTRKAMALLIYLSVEGGRHSRDKLTALFWPDSDAERGRMVMRRTLALLRQTLAEPSETPHILHLVAEGDTLHIAINSGLELDTRILEEAASLSSSQEAQSCDRSQLQRASALYRGDFLDGFTLPDAPDFNDWAITRREGYHRKIALLLDHLSQMQAESGDIAGAVDSASRWVALDSLNEAAYQRLMVLHLAAANRPAALRVYDACKSMLNREWNASPAPETESLAERIRLEVLPSRRSTSSFHDRHSPALLVSPLVGRANQFGALVECYYGIKGGRTQAALLEGEAGIGKTRIATDFLQWAIAQGASVLRARAFETGGRLPYQPFIEALRSRLDGEPLIGDLVSDRWLAELGRLLPELHDRYPGLPAPTTDESIARSRLFEAVALLLSAFAARSPCSFS